ncbi:spore coat protein CotJB [Halalkalibacillus sediminis]|nr:spore coat protein CotJB [Halalkalibacillus sediminis]
MMEKIQAIDFTLVELTLYLDTHPEDSYALEQFNSFAELSHQHKRQFEEKFGPLMQFGRSFVWNEWSWNSPPWPWQV